jgi:hypothetical protein
MPQIRVNKETLKGFEQLPVGTYTLRLDGFEPKFSQDKKSVNLRPKLVVVGNANPELNDGKHRAFDTLNSQAGWIHIEFCHGFGLQLDGEENGVPMENWSAPTVGIPGQFNPDPADADNPEKWTYEGPLLGKTTQVEIVSIPGFKKGTKERDPNKPQSVIGKYYCTVPGCQHKHLESLV